jgi:hypothetical protein
MTKMTKSEYQELVGRIAPLVGDVLLALEQLDDARSPDLARGAPG